MIFKRITFFMMAFMMGIFCACASTEEIADTAEEEIPQYTLPPIEKETVPAIGGDLIFPIPENPATLNPLKIKNVELYNLFTLIYEKPIKIDVDGKAQPELAETWDVDETGTIWTFKLREGVKWQKDYGEFTAADIIYTIDLIKSYSAADSGYSKYNDVISSYYADGDYKIVITLSQPGNAAIYFMTFPVLCKKYFESGNIDTSTPVGTGPYAVSEYEEKVQMLLEANSLWWKQAPFIQKLTAKCFPNHDTELAAFSLKFIDFVTTSVLTVDTYQKYGETESIDYLTQYYDCLIPNITGDIFGDINMRLALAYALDKRDIISKALLGHAVATDYPIAPDSYLYGGSTNIYEYNLQKSIELLELAGWKDRDDDEIFEKVEASNISDLTLELLIPLHKEDVYRRDVAENIALQLKNCGMEVTVVEEPEDIYKQKLKNKEFDLALCSFYIDKNPDISFMLKSGEAANYGGFSDMEFDTLLQNCTLALDEEQMISAYAALEERFAEQAPQIGLYYRTNALIYDIDINIPDKLRDMNIFSTLPHWYIYTEDME